MQPDYSYNAKVIRVVDGDTFDAIVDLGFNICVKQRFRIANIDAPETYGVKKESEEYKAGKVVTERLKELIESKDVLIKSQKTGKYGRYIAEVFFEGNSVGDTLLSEGLVEKY